MKLISEMTSEVEYLTESTKDGKSAKYIHGVFMQAIKENRNGRSYPLATMKNAVSKYVTEKVSKGCAYGELNHPSGPQIDLERACIIINSLDVQESGQVIGKARITETPVGQIVRGLIESGACLGVSSRGLGSLKEVNGINEVQQDFRLVTAADVVADPSAHEAYVQGVMEGVDWLYNENTGEWVEDQKKILQTKTIQQIQEAKLFLFNKFLKTL
jgi:hypothetical protein